MTTVATYQIITPDGVPFNLDAMPGGCGYIIHGLENIGMPPVRAYTHYVPGQSGAVLDDLLDDVRVITISHAATGADIDNVFEEMNDVLANYRYNRTLTLQPLRLRVTFGSKSADLYCYYNGMTTGKMDNRHALFGINLVAYDPYWYSTTETSTALDTSDSLAVSFILARVGGLWTSLGDPGMGPAEAMAMDSSGDLYVVGSFTSWAGIAGADYIAKYDVSAGTWGAVGATPLNGAVYGISITATGTIYIVGGFTNAGGDGTADYVARLLSGGADWTSVTPAGACNGTLYAVLLTDDGYVWVGGDFTSINGVAAVNVAKYLIATPTWTAAAGIVGAVGEYVAAIKQGQDGTIYIAGGFVNASADPDADHIAYWTGTAWAAVGGPANGNITNLAVAPDGTLYAAGPFTVWNGVTCNYVGSWNGAVVSAMDSGLNAGGESLWIDDRSRVWVTGAFTSAGGVGIFNGIAIWNGNGWEAITIGFPAGTTVYTVFTDGDDLYFGFDTSGTAYVPGDTSVTYSGNVAYPPTITITGAAIACTLRHIRNETTGVEILANLYISPGETITIDLGAPGEIPAGKSITSSWAARPNGDNLLGKILSPTALTRFTLAPAPIAASGANIINFKITGTAPTAAIKRYNRFDSLQAALD